MKYKANVTVEAILYDGTPDSKREVEAFCGKKLRFDVICINNMKTHQGIFVVVNGLYGKAYIPILKDHYVVKYPSGLIYPYKKSTFEKRFTLIKDAYEKPI